MEKHLIDIAEIWSQVENDLNAVTRAMVQCQQGQMELMILGVNLKKRFPVTQAMLLKEPPDKFRKAAQEGRLFFLQERGLQCCAPEMERQYMLPLMMERLEVVLARRSKAGPASLEKPAPPKQAALDLPK